jgi:hypothetical protein
MSVSAGLQELLDFSRRRLIYSLGTDYHSGRVLLHLHH